MESNSVDGQASKQKILWHVLYLFSGPKRDADGLGAFCQANGFACRYADKEFDVNDDLVDQQVWETLSATLDNYCAYMLSPPCSTFGVPGIEGQSH